MNIKSNLRILMACNGFTSLKQLCKQSGVSWEILKKLDESNKIGSIRIGNIFKVCKSLSCKIDDLVVIPYKNKDYSYLNLKNSGFKSNLQILMSVNDIYTIKDLMRYSGVSWKVANKLRNFIEIETLELSSILKICSALDCKIEDLLNIEYGYDLKDYSFLNSFYINYSN